jgi:hypothetical protein
MRLAFLHLLILPLCLSGCTVATAVITAPIKLGEVVYDTATESQEEADIKRGRAARKADDKAKKDAKKARREAERARR